MNITAQHKRDMLYLKLVEAGYVQDKWGNLVRNVTYRRGTETFHRVMRVRLAELSARIEIQGTERDATGRLPWLRMTSAYYNQMVECDDGRMLVGSLFIGSKKASYAQPN